MAGVNFEGPLKIGDGSVCVSLARGENAEIIPGVWQRAGISGMKLKSAFEIFPRFFCFLLLQADTADTVEDLGARGIIPQGLAKEFFGLVVIAALVKDGAE